MRPSLICLLVLSIAISTSTNATPPTRPLDDKLIETCQVGSVKAVSALVSQGANVNARSSDGQTPLGSAIYDHNFEVVKFLIQKGANPNALNYQSPAWMTSLYDPQIMDYLLSHGARVNALDSEGLTALQVAAKEHGGELTRILIAHGADINVKTKAGETLFALAAKRRDTDYEREDVVAALIAAGEKDAHPLPRKPDISLSVNSDEVALIRSIVSDRSTTGNTFSLLDQDTVSGPDAAHVLHMDRENARTRKFMMDLEQKMTPELLAVFLNSKEPSKVIPPLDDTPRVHYARDRVIKASFRNGSWSRFYTDFPGANGIEHVSLPVFDKSHHRAIIYHSGSSGGLSGGGQLLLLEKSRETWTIIQSVELWVS